MRTPATIARHPIHPMLIVFPVGLWVFSLVCDFIALSRVTPEAEALWSTVALYTMAGGLIGALAAAVPGFIDLLSITDSQVKKIGYTHMGINLTVVVLYAVNLWLRFGGMESRLPVGLSLFTVLLLVVSGWLGGEMVHRYAIGVEPQTGDRRHSTLAEQKAAIEMHGERRMANRFG